VRATSETGREVSTPYVNVVVLAVLLKGFVCEEKILRSVASPISSESPSDRPSGTTSNSQSALSHAVRASRRSPTARVCVRLLVNSFVICAVSSSRDSIRNETVYVCIVRLYGSAVAAQIIGQLVPYLCGGAYDRWLDAMLGKLFLEYTLVIRGA
jgi:hypothetical protein